MKTFLQICQDVVRESGISGNGPVTVTATSPVLEYRIIRWVKQAWLDIQEHRDFWPWREVDVDVTLEANKQIYTPDDLSLTNIARWRLDAAVLSVGTTDMRYLQGVPYNFWLKNYRVTSDLATEPSVVTARPLDNALIFHHIPAQEYTVRIQYQKTPQELVANTDVPELPTGGQWSDIIQWKALMYYGFYDNAPEILAEATDMYNKKLFELDRRYGPAQQLTCDSFI